jgi:hypothetical protein
MNQSNLISIHIKEQKRSSQWDSIKKQKKNLVYKNNFFKKIFLIYTHQNN